MSLLLRIRNFRSVLKQGARPAATCIRRNPDSPRCSRAVASFARALPERLPQQKLGRILNFVSRSIEDCIYA